MSKTTPFKEVDSSKKLPKVEEEVLKFWEENKIFEKSLENRKTDDDSNLYSFYDGPPFATGLPHYGHIVGSLMKDIIPRYWTMKGKYIPRKWGWDCHGLPIENIVEKEMGSRTKKEIEELGVDKFNEMCRSKVLAYADEWEKIIPRLGRWADMKDSYRTMDRDFMESVWWTFKQLWDKDLIYYNYRSMHVCPRCETTLSQSEVSEGYKDVKDLSVIAEFNLIDEPKTSILAWTTTPWTLPGNVALAVGKDINYVKIEKKDEGTGELVQFILAKNKLKEFFGEAKSRKVFLISGKHAFASRIYFPQLKKDLEKDGYNVTIIDHVNPTNPNLEENLKAFKKYDLKNAHVITHSLGASTILTHLTNTDTHLLSLTMIAPPYPGKTLFSTNKIWEKESGYVSAMINAKKIKQQITHTPVILYSNDSIIPEEDFERLGKDLNAKLIKEKNKAHYFEPEVNNSPDFDIISNLQNYTNYKIIDEFKGKDLVGLKYKPLWDIYANDEKLENRKHGWQIYGADFVTTDEGTGVVHIAPAFGEDDMNLGKEKNLPFVQHVAMNGVVDEKVEAIGGLNVKPIDNPQSTDVEVIKYLANKGLLFDKEKYEHSYPHCWRCDTPLINYATGSWFVAVTKIKKQLLENAKDINWTPKHIKEGRFGNWLEGARDWSISRQRFWASVMPIWVCDKCGEKKVFGSVTALKDASGVEVDDLHKHIVDKVTFKCESCEGTMKRVPDVLDTWFDSGSMPYGQAHYPFDNKESFEKSFPADFIAEGIDQTRAWFYYLHVIAGGVFDKKAFKNVIVNGIVLAEDGQKMSKKLQNYPDPMEMVRKYGADPLRFYLAQSPVVNANDLNFSEKDLAEIARGTFRMLWQSYSFFVMYANVDQWSPQVKSQKFKVEGQQLKEARNGTQPPTVTNLLDKWLLSELHQLIKEVNERMESYGLMQATRLFVPFVDNLSNWYIRRSRKRFWKSENDGDKNEAYATLHYVLVELSKTIAPFAPFLADEIYRNLVISTQSAVHSNEQSNGTSEAMERAKRSNEASADTTSEAMERGEADLQADLSVHLTDYPTADISLIDESINKSMAEVREIIKVGLQLRARNQMKVRQPLQELKVQNLKSKVNNELVEIIKEELNIKNVSFSNFAFDEQAKNMGEVNGIQLELNIKLTDELKMEGQAREIIRAIQQMRKEADYQLDDRIEINYTGLSEVFKQFGDLIAKETLADEVLSKTTPDFDLEKNIEVDNEKLVLQIKRG